MPWLLIVAGGMGTVMAPAIFAAAHRVDPCDAGVAAAMADAVQ